VPEQKGNAVSLKAFRPPNSEISLVVHGSLIVIIAITGLVVVTKVASGGTNRAVISIAVGVAVLCLLLSTVHTFLRLMKNITQIDIDPVARTLHVRRDISLCSCLGVGLDETHPIERLTDIWLHLDKVRDECGLHDQRVTVCLNVSRPRPENTATSREWTLQTWTVMEEGCNLDHALVALETVLYVLFVHCVLVCVSATYTYMNWKHN